MTQNIAVIAANGKSGQLIVREAVGRGLDVTAVVRGENKTVARHAVIKDLFDLTAADLAGFDVVVDAFGAWTPETLPRHSTSLKHLADVLSGADARLIVVGGAGSLYVNPEHTVQLSQTDGFPESFLPLATAMGGGFPRRISSTPKSKRFRGACACGQDPNLHGDSGLLPLGRFSTSPRMVLGRTSSPLRITPSCVIRRLLVRIPMPRVGAL